MPHQQQDGWMDGWLGFNKHYLRSIRMAVNTWVHSTVFYSGKPNWISKPGTTL